ncbi:hypothetical protein JCM8202v2_000626 [Rhodotorula sphaerocarpa]
MASTNLASPASGSPRPASLPPATSSPEQLRAAAVRNATDEVSRGTEGEQAAELKEVSVGDLERELQTLSTHVASLAASLADVFDLRQRASAQGPAFPFADLSALASRTTALSSELSSLPFAFTHTAQRFLRLEALAQQNAIAALPSELDSLREQLAAATLEARQTVVERVRSEAWDEVDARESAWRRCEERVAGENATLGPEEVGRAVEAAFEGASDSKVGHLDIESYAGRIAAENPATELAQVLDDHADDFRRVFSANVELLERHLTRGSATTGTTLVGSAPFDARDKTDKEAGEGKEMREVDVATSALPQDAAEEEEGLLAGETTSEAVTRPTRKFDKLRQHWRDYLVLARHGKDPSDGPESAATALPSAF